MTSPFQASGAFAHGQDGAAGAPTVPPSGVEPIDRPGARVLLVDGRERVLLFRGWDPSEPAHGRYWMTVGGGIDPGETDAQAAARELYEETGLRVAPATLDEPVFREVALYPFEGSWYRQAQAFYLVRVDHWEVSPQHRTPIEERSVDIHRWWTAAELEATGERFYPVELPALVRRACGTVEPVGEGV